MLNSSMIERRKLSVSDFLLMGEIGLFAPEEHVELVDGEIYTISPPSSKHAAWVDRVMKALERSFGRRTIVRVQSPVELSQGSAPEPDVAVLAPKDDFYEAELPKAQDIYLAVEICVSSLKYDRTKKLPQYASAGVPEVWLVNVDEGQIEVYREPVFDRYRVRWLLGLDEAVTPVAIPETSGITF